MRMRCQFCDQELFLIRQQDPRHSKYSQLWECRNHPTVDSVIHVIHYKRQTAKSGGKDPEKWSGKLRLWRDTIISWKTESGRVYEAHYQRYQHPLHPNMTQPSSFQVRKIPFPKESLSFSQQHILLLQKHPTNMTPENIISKVQTYVVFS